MIEFSDIENGKSGFVFELDNVLYPEKDYDLQVFYLFANLLEYSEGAPVAADLTHFLKKSYESQGLEGLMDKASAAFGIDKKYHESFNRLRVNAQLPLRLLLYPSILRMLHAIRKADRTIFILTRGNPLMQLNKIKYVDWEGLDKHLKVYFYDEIKVIKQQEPLLYLMEENQLNPKDIVFFGHSEQDKVICKDLEVDFFNASLF